MGLVRACFEGPPDLTARRAERNASPSLTAKALLFILFCSYFDVILSAADTVSVFVCDCSGSLCCESFHCDGDGDDDDDEATTTMMMI